MCYNCISACHSIDHQCQRFICHGHPKNINQECIQKYFSLLNRSQKPFIDVIPDHSSYIAFNDSEINTNEMIEYIGNLEENFHWNEYRKYIRISCGMYFNDNEIYCSTQCLPPSLNFLSNEQQVYHQLSSFLKTLPNKSKYFIWKHALKNVVNLGGMVGDMGGDIIGMQVQSKMKMKMFKVEHMLRLLIDTLLVYIQFLDRNRNLQIQGMLIRLTMNCCLYLWMSNGPLTQVQFINKRQYFPNLLLKYSEIQPRLEYGW